MASKEALELHRQSLVIDGLLFQSDGSDALLRAGNVAAANVTVCGLNADFEEACDQLAVWLGRLAQPDGPWLMIRRTADILEARKRGKRGLIMGWQNMRPTGDKPERLRFFHDIGVRVMQLTYNERNLIGDGCLEAGNGGLSQLGRRAIAAMNELGIAIDLSHVGERSCLDAIEQTTRPLLITHANAKAVSDVPRNKSDSVIKGVAASGGLIGISVYGPMCWNGDPSRRPALADFIRHAEHIVGLVGPEHLALGTDFPAVENLDEVAGVIRMTLARYPAAISAYAKAFGNDVRTRYLSDCDSPASLAALTDALLSRGWREPEIKGLLGENYMKTLPKIWID